MPGGTRRSFLRTALGAALVPLTTRCKSDPEPTLDAPAIVVGTGFGGAVAALRLAEAGVKTILLERGRRWPITPAGDTFATFDKADERCAWLSMTTNFPGAPFQRFEKKHVGVLERIFAKGTSVVVGSCYGGGSVVYGATLVQPPKALFEQVFPAGVDYESMSTVYYPRARAAIGASPIPDDVLAAPTYASARRFFDDCAKAGMNVFRNDVGADWDVVREEIAGKRVASAIAGQIVYGVNSGAKNSVDRSYLALAEKTGLVDVRTQHVVRDLGKDALGYMVSCDQIDAEGNVVGTVLLRSRWLFLAAGSMGTSKLLVRAKARGSLPALNEHVGTQWGNNGDYVLARQIGIDTLGIQGGPPSGMAFDHQNPLGAVSLDHGTASTGLECQCQPILAMGIAPAGGTFAYDASTDDVTLTWDPKLMGTIPDAAKAALQKIIDAGGGSILDVGQLLGNYTYHPLGGAVMGKACDLHGRVAGYPGMYVVDGALLPGSAGGVNPALTVAAIAERCIERIIAEDVKKS
jgi:cholesterol oxidase